MLQWTQNERDGVLNHRRLDCLLNRLFRSRSKKTLKLRVTSLFDGTSPVIGEFPSQRPVTLKMFPFDDVIIYVPRHLVNWQFELNCWVSHSLNGLPSVGRGVPNLHLNVQFHMCFYFRLSGYHLKWLILGTVCVHQPCHVVCNQRYIGDAHYLALCQARRHVENNLHHSTFAWLSVSK